MRPERLIAAAQKAAEDLRAADIAATKAELERLRAKAAADIVAERDRALADLRSQVADLALAAAGKVVRETMTDARQRRLVEEFLREESGTTGGAGTTDAATLAPARRYAEAVFELATRDGKVDEWRREIAPLACAARRRRASLVRASTARPCAFARSPRGGGAAAGQARLAAVLNLALIARSPRPLRAAAGRSAPSTTPWSGVRAASSAPPSQRPRRSPKRSWPRGRRPGWSRSPAGPVEMSTTTDPSLIGGLRVTIGDRQIDASVSTRLARLRRQLVQGPS